ncbi:MAG: LuxR C-terminal-related transcriptional regulator [Stenomitos frigidus ULC029]
MLIHDHEAPDRLPYSLPPYSKTVSPAPRLLATPAFDSSVESLSLFSVLVDALPNGLIVLSPDHDIIYWNQNAKRLCQKLSSTQRHLTLLPTIVAELGEQVVEAGTATETIFLEYQTPDERSFRLTARWLRTGTDDFLNAALSHQIYILVTIEDRDEVFQQDIQAEQKKFHLTNREAEVWLLLKREYSYQAIATTLHISLNTVKTHIRNIHTKRHPYQSLSA